MSSSPKLPLALVVTREESFYDLLCMLLEEESYRAIRIPSAELLNDDVSTSGSPFFYILDLDSLESELELLNKWNKENSAMVVIALAWEKETLRSLSFTPFAFLRKPFDVDEFSVTIKQLEDLKGSSSFISY